MEIAKVPTIDKQAYKVPQNVMPNTVSGINLYLLSFIIAPICIFK